MDVKLAETTVPVHEALRRRWSPRAFDTCPIELEKLRSLFEAARWAPSCFNTQPWHYLVATKDDPLNYQRVLNCFIKSNQGWAKNAPVVALSVARLNFEHNGEPNRHAFHDVGQATANLAMQAATLGLQIHQMAGILPDRARTIFGIPEGYEPVAGIALGYSGDPGLLPEKLRNRELAPRERKPLASFVFTKCWGQALQFTALKPKP